ncbi:MAG: type II secretion system F family protein, partial [Deltaproteobacteria bacterium]|nr:type II secretion system F family protein [Deltaproteobacteria bacterium]MBW2323181.1 type II secretion system F family protein [Deltaproteobacteria bacterium]
MPVYSYRALNSKGKTVRGVLDAESPLRARTKLRTDGLFPIDVHPPAAPRARGRTLSQLKHFLTRRRNPLKLLVPVTRQMATLQAAGLPVVQALDTIQEQTEDHDFRQVLALIKERVTSGESLAEALEGHSDLFPAEYIHLVRAGEMSGSLGPVLDRLAKNLEMRQARRAKIYSALTYPAFMTVVGTGVVFFLLSFVVPTMTGLFADLGAALPWPTRFLLGLAGILRNYWWALLLILTALIVLGFRLLRNEERYRFVEKLLFHVPVVGGLLKKLLLAQVLRSMALLSSGGVTLTTSLQVT